MIQLCLLLLLLVGCSAHHQTGYQPEALRYYPLLLPSSYRRTIAIEQLIEGWAKGEHFQFYAQLEIDPDHMLVLGFTTFQFKAFGIL